MNRTLRAIIAVIFIAIITGSAISICQSVGKAMRMDITEQKIYTLSDGTKAIVGRLVQPITMKLYYAKTATTKASDSIRFFNTYYSFVRALLEEYANASEDMIDLQIIDPRPFSDEEEEALRHGLRRFPITEEENFFFGLVVQTQFGVTKSIDFFSPERQRFVEYDISSLIDKAITQQKKRIGVLSSLDVMGEEISGYMAQMMRMQGKEPKQPWRVVQHLRQMYDVTKIEADTEKIAKDNVDILFIIHPKSLSEKTLFAIDQYVLSGGRTIICTDPHCLADQGDPAQQMQGKIHDSSSDVNRLLRAWGLEMPKDVFAGDKKLALTASMRQNERPKKIIGFLQLTPESMNKDNIVTARLNQVRVLFSGILEKVSQTELVKPGSTQEENAEATTGQITLTPLVQTTSQGNSWRVSSPYELMMPDPDRMMKKFIPGTKPVIMGYQITGYLPSAFPDGIELAKDDSESEEQDANPEHRMWLAEASQECAVIVFADVDFISDLDNIAYRQSFFGLSLIGDNSTLLLNSIESLTGSSELISIRSRGNFRRSFTKVDEIEMKAEEETAQEAAKWQAEIDALQKELNDVLASAESREEAIIAGSEVVKKRDLEFKRRKAERGLREANLHKNDEINTLGNKLRNINMLSAPAFILIVAIVLAIYRGVKSRQYHVHESDS